MDRPRVLLNAQEIAARIDALAADIARTLLPEFVVVGLLKSAAVFVADLVRALGYPVVAPDDEPAIVEAIERLLDAKRQGGIVVSDRHDAVAAPYDIRHTAAAFAGVLERCA